MNKKPAETNGHTNKINGYAEVMTDDAQKATNGHLANGLTNGHSNTDKVAEAKNHASGPEGVNGLENGGDGVDHHTNGD